jgi:hypothetical protein
MPMKAKDESLKYIEWAKQVADESAAWADAKRKTGEHKTTDGELAAYREGVRQGYLRAIADVRTHGGKL